MPRNFFLKKRLRERNIRKLNSSNISVALRVLKQSNWIDGLQLKTVRTGGGGHCGYLNKFMSIAHEILANV